MYKTRIIPEHKEQYKVCDHCGEEITDYSSMTLHLLFNENGQKEKHYHSMHSGGAKGRVKRTCYELSQNEDNELQ